MTTTGFYEATRLADRDDRRARREAARARIAEIGTKTCPVVVADLRGTAVRCPHTIRADRDSCQVHANLIEVKQHPEQYPTLTRMWSDFTVWTEEALLAASNRPSGRTQDPVNYLTDVASDISNAKAH